MTEPKEDIEAAGTFLLDAIAIGDVARDLHEAASDLALVSAKILIPLAERADGANADDVTDIREQLDRSTRAIAVIAARMDQYLTDDPA